MADGGYAPCGAIEIKVVERLPALPLGEHVLQVAGYSSLLRQNRASRSVWAALAYVSFRESKVRHFAFLNTNAIEDAFARLATVAAA